MPGNIILCVLITIIVLLLTTVIMADYNRNLDGCDSPEGYYMNERYRCLKGWTIFLFFVGVFVVIMMSGMLHDVDYLP